MASNVIQEEMQLETTRRLDGYDNPTLQTDVVPEGSSVLPTYAEHPEQLSKSSDVPTSVSNNVYVVTHNDNHNKDKANLDNYNPYEHRDVKHPTSYSDSLIHMLRASWGTGILAMPNAFSKAGYIIGILGTMLIGTLCTYCIHLIIQSHYLLCKKRKVPSLTYAGITEAALEEGPSKLRWFAPYGRMICTAFLVLYQVGACCIYVVFISSNIKSVCDIYFEIRHVRVYMLYIFVPTLLICWVRNLKYLAPFSTIANVFSIFSFSITFYYIFSDVPSIKERTVIGQVKDYPLFFGTVLFAMEAIGVIMPLENEMKKPEKFSSMFGVLNVAMVPITLLYTFVGFFGFLKYGDEIKGSITLNLPENEILAQGVKLMFATSMLCTYALSQYVAFDIIWNNIVEAKIEKSKLKIFYEYCVRSLIVTTTFVLAAAIPNLDLFISLIGALCLATLGVALPAIIQTLTFWYSHQGINKVFFILKNIFIIILAIMGFVVGVTTSGYEIMQQVFHIKF